MNDPVLERLFAVNEIANADEYYRKIQAEYSRFEKEFTAFVNRQPQKYRNFLWGYPDMANLMNQRKLTLACTYMDFLPGKDAKK